MQLSQPKLRKRKNRDLRPALTSKDISDEIKITKARPPLIYQQFFAYEYKCYPSGTWATLFTFHLNCKYHSWGLINDMQMSIYNRKHWHALSHSLQFVRHEGDWRPTRPPQRVSRVPDYLFMYSIQSVLGLSQVLPIPYYNAMNNITQG